MNRSANATPRLSGWAKCQLLRARARGAGGGPTGRRRSTCCSEPLPRRAGRTRCSQPVRTACHQALRGWGGSLNVTQLEQGDGLETKGSVNTHTNLVHTRTGTQAHTPIHTSMYHIHAHSRAYSLVHTHTHAHSLMHSHRCFFPNRGLKRCGRTKLAMDVEAFIFHVKMHSLYPENSKT